MDKLILVFLAVEICRCQASEYILDPSVGLGRQFDGIGAISGGGATSKLLISYPKQQRNEILDFLFKPNFGASLHILKVEIGGDAQSSEGSEASHMHYAWDENYQRGYEWWLMTEAKRRNPDIRLYGLAWGYPGWLGGNSWDPYRFPNLTAGYITRWILGAKKYYNLDIDYIGIWNEKPYDSTYIKTLRHTMNANGLNRVKIVAADDLPSSAETIIKDMERDAELRSAVDIVGMHYTGLHTSDMAKNCSKPLWSSEDYASSPSENGAGCFARIINRNYLVGSFTSTIAWNLINSYYNDLLYGNVGLMRANQPWSGYYEVSPPIWATAHTTQFVQIGWTYLKHGYGVSALAKGGSLVTLMSPDNKDVTIVIETMDTSQHQHCLYAPDVARRVYPQDITLVFKGQLINITSLHLWRTSLYGNSSTVLFNKEGVVKVDSDGHLKLSLDVDSVYTLTTLDVGSKSTPGKVPQPAFFPIPYSDDFNVYLEYQEPYHFTSQVGSFEVRESNHVNHGKVLRQVVLEGPIHWCPITQTSPLGVIGNYNWSDISVTVDVFVPSINATNGVHVGLRIDQASCYSFMARGVYLFLLFGDSEIVISRDLERTDVVYSNSANLVYDTWYTINIQLKDSLVKASIDGATVYNSTVSGLTKNGFVGLGTDSWGLADFDNLHIVST